MPSEDNDAATRTVPPALIRPLANYYLEYILFHVLDRSEPETAP